MLEKASHHPLSCMAKIKNRNKEVILTFYHLPLTLGGPRAKAMGSLPS